MAKWQEIGNKLVDQLDGLTNEADIRQVCIQLITEEVLDKGLGLKSPITDLRAAIKNKYPIELDVSKPKPDGYYYTSANKGHTERYEHLALWYISEAYEKQWPVIGDDARKQYWKKQAKQTAQAKRKPTETETSETSGKPSQKTTQKPITPKKADRPTLTTKMLETALIDSLELDEETLELLYYSLEKSGQDLAEFLRDSIRINARATAGRYKRLDVESLENVPTSELLNNPTYATYPGRAEEMVRRAIQAIKIYNSEIATEPKQRWIITQSLLSELTGSRGSVVQSAMQKYRDDIDSHHQKYPEFFNEDGTLKQYFNRKRGVEIRDEIDLVKLVPNG